MRKSGTILAVLGLAVLASGGSALATTTNPIDDTSAAASRYTVALNLLENKGYSNFTDFHQVGNDFQATVNHAGKSTTVMVNPDNGTVHAQ